MGMATCIHISESLEPEGEKRTGTISLHAQKRISKIDEADIKYAPSMYDP